MLDNLKLLNLLTLHFSELLKLFFWRVESLFCWNSSFHSTLTPKSNIYVLGSEARSCQKVHLLILFVEIFWSVNQNKF